MTFLAVSESVREDGESSVTSGDKDMEARWSAKNSLWRYRDALRRQGLNVD